METSATFDQAEAAYYAMKEASEPAPKNAEYEYVFTGALTNLLAENGIPRSRYSYVTKVLKDLGSIESARRGAGNVPSVWLLWGPPDRQAFEDGKVAKTAKGAYNARGRNSGAPTDQRIEDLDYRLKNIENRMEAAGI